MANIVETSTFDADVYLLDITDPVVGGLTGKSNMQGIALANRTRWLYDQLTPLLGKIFFSVSYGTTVTVGSGGSNVNADNSAYSLAYPVGSPDYTTPDDGETRTYKITMSAFCNFTYNASGNVQMVLYTSTVGPVYSGILTWNLRQPYQYIAMTKVVSIGPGVELKAMFGNNATGANAVFTDAQLIIEEV